MTLSSERNTQQMQLWGRLMAALPFSLWPRAATKPSVWWTSSMLTSQGESECLSLSLALSLPFYLRYQFPFSVWPSIHVWFIVLLLPEGSSSCQVNHYCSFLWWYYSHVKNLLKMPHIYGHFDHVRTDLKATWEEVKRKSVPTSVQLIDSTKNLQKWLKLLG